MTRCRARCPNVSPPSSRRLTLGTHSSVLSLLSPSAPLQSLLLCADWWGIVVSCVLQGREDDDGLQKQKKKKKKKKKGAVAASYRIMSHFLV